MPRETFAPLNRLRHHLLHWGDAAAPTVVLVHGFLDLAWSFDPFAQALARRLPANIVAPDLRGHGETEWVGRGGYYHFADYVADVHALVSSLPGPRFVVGHSMGGGIAALLAGAFPQLVHRLVLVEGLGPPTLSEDAFVSTSPERMAQWIHDLEARASKAPRPMPTRADAARRLREANPRMPEPLAKLLAEKGTREVEGGFVWAYDPLHRTRSPSPASVEQFNAFLRRIDAPTLLVEGAQSEFRQWVADDRERHLAHLERARIADAGHHLHQDQPEALAEVVAKFLGAGG